MALFLRRGVIGVTLGVLLFCISCEKHPLGQMQDVQQEQPDPATVWSNVKKNSDESSASPTPVESFPHEAR